MTFIDTVYYESSAVSGFFDVQFPVCSDPESHSFSQANVVSFDQNGYQPNNIRTSPDGIRYYLGAPELDDQGHQIARCT
jgi:hypothetical protein